MFATARWMCVDSLAYARLNLFAYENVNLLTRFVHKRLKMTVLDHQRPDRPAQAIMDALGQAIVLARRIEVKGALIGPVAHDRETIEQGDTPQLGHGPHFVPVTT